MTENLPQVNVRYQITNPGSPETTKHTNTPKTIQRCIIFKLKRIKDKEKNIPEEARGKITTYERKKIRINSYLSSETVQTRRK